MMLTLTALHLSYKLAIIAIVIMAICKLGLGKVLAALVGSLRGWPQLITMLFLICLCLFIFGSLIWAAIHLCTSLF